MGLFSNFFGGAESKSKVVQTDNWNSKQKRTFNDLYAQIKEQGLGPAPTSPDAFVPTTAQDQQYLDYANSQAVRNMATGVVPYDVGPEYAQQYFEQAIRPIAEREWRETTLPGIQEQYAGSTFNSTGRDRAVVEATERFGENLTAAKSKLTYDEELAKREAIEKAYGRVGQGTDIAGKAATYSRAIETEKVMNAVQKYLMGEEVNGQYNAAYNPMITLAFNLLGLKPFTSSVETKSQGAGLGNQMVQGIVDFNSGAMIKDLIGGGGQPTTQDGTTIQSLNGAGGEGGYRSNVGGWNNNSAAGIGSSLFGSALKYYFGGTAGAATESPTGGE